MCALLPGLFIRGDHEGGGLAKEGKKCVFKGQELGLAESISAATVENIYIYPIC